MSGALLALALWLAPPAALPAAQDAASGPAQAHPLVARVAQRAEQLAALETAPEGFAARAEDAAADQQRLADQLRALVEARERVSARVARTGLSTATRLFLRRQRSLLPPPHELETELAAREQQVDAVQSQLLRLEQERVELDDVDARVAGALEGLEPGPDDGAGRDALAGALRRGWLDLRARIDRELDAGSACLEQLVLADETQRRLVAEAREFRTLIEASSLWIRSAEPLDDVALPALWGSALDATRWLLRPANWRAALSSLWSEARRSPLVALGTLLVIVVVLRQRRRLLGQLQATAESAAADRFRPTLRAAGVTLLLAGLWPAVIWLLAWRLTPAQGATSFAAAVGAGLADTAFVAFGLQVLEELGRPRGLAEAHLGWPEGVARSVRRHVGMLAAIVLPATFVIATLQAQPNDAWSDALGRLMFMAACLTLAFVVRHMLRPEGRVARVLMARGGGASVMRVRLLWQAPLVLLPLGLVLLAALGYYATALVLLHRLLLSVAFAVALLIVHALLLRAVAVARRRLVKLQAAHAARFGAAEPDDEGLGVSGEAALDDASLARLDEQSRRVLDGLQLVALAVGLWLVWSAVLPALSVVEGVTLWEHEVTQSRPASELGGLSALAGPEDAPAGTVTVLEPVTLADLLLALLVVVAGTVAVRNVPALLEMLLLRRLPLDAGGHYAVKTLTRYVLTVATIALFFGALGVGWGDVQWLAAAVTVGLGFGLQEIFANFVSGVILLVERPVRVGDTVTVGGVTGTVARIRMRATTIVDWDRKELVVPNKEFITTQLVNWTLADSILRVIVKVGIAYGSDTRKATELLYGVAARNADVLKQPVPRVLFVSFGESSLDFELRVWVDSPELVRQIPHDLNLAIDDAFREAGIEIAFPQRDLHLRSVSPQAGRALRAATEG